MATRPARLRGGPSAALLVLVCAQRPAAEPGTRPPTSAPASPGRPTPRDLAKLGYLHLKGGTWEGRQVVPAVKD